MAKAKTMINAGINTDSVVDHALTHRNVRHYRVSDGDVELFYSFGNKIGQGSFGTVLSVTEKDTDKVWAMKIITKPTISVQLKAIEREIQILKIVDHPNIIYLDKVYESANKIYLILEKCNKELSKILLEKSAFTQDETRKVIKDLLGAVYYLHRNDIVHRDLKLENILVTTNPANSNDALFIKLADFGLSIIKSGHTIMLHERCGTLTYMSPEIIKKSSYSQQCDVWSVGIIMFLLLTGQPPFIGAEEKELIETILFTEPLFEDHASAMSPEIRNLLEKLLIKNPATRITAGEALRHPWLSSKLMSSVGNSENVLEKMRLWNQELKVPQGIESDWISVMPAATDEDTRRRTFGKVPLQMSKKSIEFNRKNTKLELPAVPPPRLAKRSIVRGARQGSSVSRRTDNSSND